MSQKAPKANTTSQKPKATKRSQKHNKTMKHAIRLNEWTTNSKSNTPIKSHQWSQPRGNNLEHSTQSIDCHRRAPGMTEKMQTGMKLIRIWIERLSNHEVWLEFHQHLSWGPRFGIWFVVGLLFNHIRLRFRGYLHQKPATNSESQQQPSKSHGNPWEPPKASHQEPTNLQATKSQKPQSKGIKR